MNTKLFSVWGRWGRCFREKSGYFKNFYNLFLLNRKYLKKENLSSPFSPFQFAQKAFSSSDGTLRNCLKPENPKSEILKNPFLPYFVKIEKPQKTKNENYRFLDFW